MNERMKTTIMVTPRAMKIEHGVGTGKLYAQAENWDCHVVRARGANIAGRYSTLQYMVCLAAQELGIKQMSIRMVR